MFKKSVLLAFIVFGLVILEMFLGGSTVNAKTLDVLAVSSTLPEPYGSEFPQNNITGWNPCEGGVKSNLTAEGCFKINSSVDAQDFWYGEGCLNTGDCTSGKYYASGQPAGKDNGLHMTKKNPFIYSETKTDNDFGGMQYIYAENYDYDYNGYDTKMTPNGGNSTQKYYWIVLPDQAYSNGFGDTYVATFENLSEPVYFIVFDTHACRDQGENYCDKAKSDPDGVEAGKEFLGAFTKNGGSFQEAARIAGKLTSLCRIKGSGEVLASQSHSSITLSSSSNSSSNGSGGSSTTSSKTVAEKIWNWFVKANISGLSDNPAAIAGIIGAFSTEAGGNTIDGLTPFSWSNWGGTLLGCIPQYCGNIKDKVTQAVGEDYFAYKTGVDGIPEEAVDKAIDLELNFMIKDYNNGVNWKTFIDNLDVVAEKTPESYAELFEVIVQNAADSSGDSVQDDGIIKWVSNHPGYSTVQQVLSKKRELAREAYEKLAGDNCTNFEGDYPQYYQGNYADSDHENSSQDWTSIPYDGGDVGDSGCGPTSMAMLATVAAGQDIYPQDVIEATEAKGCYVYMSPTELDPLVGEKYGFEVISETYSSKTDAYDKIKKYLNDGYMIHLSGEGAHAGFSNGTNGHYVGIFSIDSEDRIWVANSNGIGNSQVKLQDIIDAIHNEVFTAIKGNGGGNCNNTCSNGNSDNTTGGGNVVQAAADIIELANKNSSTYTWGGGHTSDASVFDAMLNGSPINVDCTGFASLTMYKAFGKMTSFTSSSIASDPLYEEIPRSEVRPGDIFAYNSPQGHGGIVIEADNGVVTKIAHTGGTEGRAGRNTNIGYASGTDNYTIKNINGPNGHLYRWKGEN